MRSLSRLPPNEHHPRRPGHLPAALVSAGLVVVLHGWLLAGLPRALPAGEAAKALRTVQVRQILTRAPPAATVAAPAHRPWSASPASPRRTQSGPPRLSTAAAAPGAPATISVEPGRAAEPPPTLTAQPTQPAQPAPSGGAPPTETPTYATRLAPPATLHYALRRGTVSGRAVLQWAPDGELYTLGLQAHLPPAPPTARVSRGTIDAHGIAPERYTESRRGRELRAVNFRRDRGRITYSGPQLEHELPAGAQDRLSWMLQLGAVLAADQRLALAGQTVLLFVAGTRGDAEVWTFEVLGPDRIELPGSGTGSGAGALDTVLLRREPRHEHDPRVEVWLDPARHHLPVRVSFTVRGESTQFVLDQRALP